MKIDVVIPTLNSESRLGEAIFRTVLRRVTRYLPLNNLLVVDDNSKDRTVEIAKSYGAKIIKGEGSLGKAREIGVENVQTEWFYFIDDDNIIDSDFHKRMISHIADDVGMIYPSTFYSLSGTPTGRYDYYLYFLRKSLGLKDVAEERGYTGATLLRKKAVENIPFPDIARQEDRFIKEKIAKHWKVKYVSDIAVLHYHVTRSIYKVHYQEGVGLAKTGYVSYRRVLQAWLLSYVKTLLLFPCHRSIQTLNTIPRLYFVKFLGYRKARE